MTQAISDFPILESIILTAAGVLTNTRGIHKLGLHQWYGKDLTLSAKL